MALHGDDTATASARNMPTVKLPTVKLPKVQLPGAVPRPAPPPSAAVRIAPSPVNLPPVVAQDDDPFDRTMPGTKKEPSVFDLHDEWGLSREVECELAAHTATSALPASNHTARPSLPTPTLAIPTDAFAKQYLDMFPDLAANLPAQAAQADAALPLSGVEACSIPLETVPDYVPPPPDVDVLDFLAQSSAACQPPAPAPSGPHVAMPPAIGGGVSCFAIAPMPEPDPCVVEVLKPLDDGAPLAAVKPDPFFAGKHLVVEGKPPIPAAIHPPAMPRPQAAVAREPFVKLDLDHECLSDAERVIWSRMKAPGTPSQGPQKFAGVEFHADMLEHAQWVEPAAGGPCVKLDFLYTGDFATMIQSRIQQFGIGVQTRTEIQERALKVALTAGRGRVSLIKLAFDPDAVSQIHYDPGKTPIFVPPDIELACTPLIRISVTYRLSDAFRIFSTVWHPDLVLSVLDGSKPKR